MKKVYVGMSGGVDSSVTAALLKEQGYDVTGVYMKNWSQDLPGMVCPWKQDYQDAKRVAVQLGIPFKMYDFETEYRQRVVDYMIAEYRGRPHAEPRHHVQPGSEVQAVFGNLSGGRRRSNRHRPLRPRLARIGRASRCCRLQCSFAVPFVRLSPRFIGAQRCFTDSHQPKAKLLTAANAEKDQTYFLYRVTEDALKHSLMPIGEFATKAEVRAKAKELGLATAEKKDSQGICFVGKIGIKDFLLYELGEQPHGRYHRPERDDGR